MKLHLFTILLIAASSINTWAQPPPGMASVPTVFLIVMENHPWSKTPDAKKHPTIKDNPDAPYINKTLVPMGAHAEQCFSHIPDFGNSLPNYIWLECGQKFFNNDNPPSKSHAPHG